MSHKLHTVLVTMDDVELFHVGVADADNIKEIERTVRDAANYYTDKFTGKVFDRREPTYSSDRIESDQDSGVVLGMNEPDRFVTLLRKWAEAPKRECEYHLGYWQGVTQNSIRAMSSLPDVNDCDFVEKWWPAEPGVTAMHHLKVLAEMLDGEYLFESGFYSGPDESPKISQEILADATENPGNYALVFWVYHI